MKIVVCAKFVPDATADRRFRSEDNTVDRAGVDGLLSELDEYAVETALTVKEAGDAEVTTCGNRRIRLFAGRSGARRGRSNP